MCTYRCLVPVCVCAHGGQESTLVISYLSPLSNLYFATTLPTDPGARYFGDTGRPGEVQDPPGPAFPLSTKVTDVCHHTRL